MGSFVDDSVSEPIDDSGHRNVEYRPHADQVREDDLRGAWRNLAKTDLAYALLAFAVLMPATSGLLYALRESTSSRVMADVDIAYFFLTTPAESQR